MNPGLAGPEAVAGQPGVGWMCPRPERMMSSKTSQEAHPCCLCVGKHQFRKAALVKEKKLYWEAGCLCAFFRNSPTSACRPGNVEG